MRWYSFLPLIGFVVMAIYFGLGMRQDPSSIPSQLIDEPFPIINLPALEGREFGLSNEDLQGHVSLVNVFGTWCAPCVVEHPMLMLIKRTEIVPIYGIDWRDQPGAGTEWLARRGDPYRLVGNDADGHAAIDLGVTGAPETFLLDREGRVRYHHIGIITQENWNETLLPMIRELQNS
jgi:cytochrome c biogenesis protein CcmG/thiol:disulfide interchange protein DsbE